MSLYLGFDSSTQSLTAIIIDADGDDRREVVFERSLRFDEEFPAYGTRNGVLPREDRLVARSSPLLWAEALDRMMGVIARESGLDLKRLKAISGSGQQHGSVYLNGSAESALRGLDPGRPLVEQLPGIFARETAPIWMDSSTTEQCAAITEAVGGERVLAVLTGSCAFERFTGPQIRKFWEQDPEGYERTDKIHLVSSYLASLLAGKHAPIDPGDGAGMNLMDLARKRWAPVALQATAPDLAEKLPVLSESWTIVGSLSPYWVKRYGFPESVKVVAWSGDNPCSLIGVGLVKPGRMAISLGTSDTLFGFMQKPLVDPTGGGHVFGAPTGDYMSLICFKNGSLARDGIRREYSLDWDGFSKGLRTTPPGNNGSILLPWFEPEITPPVHEPGVRRYNLAEKDGPANVRGVVEAQMMSTWLHSRWMGVETDTIYATGGAARNRDILRVMADVHDAVVYQFLVGNSACLGAALRALHADRRSSGLAVEWEDVVRGFAEPVAESRIEPDPARVALYGRLKKLYAACEAHAVRGGEDPLPLLETFRKGQG
jgi:xylulokinase